MNSPNTSLRLSKIAKEFNISIRTITDYLSSLGHNLVRDLNTKLTIAQYNLVKTHFKKADQDGKTGETNDPSTNKTTDSQPKSKQKTHFTSFQDLGKLNGDKKQKVPLTDIPWKVGQVKFFDSSKGFGFVTCWNDSREYFLHISNIEDSQIGDKDYIVFKLVPSPKRPGTLEAYNVNLVSNFTQDFDFLADQYSKYENEHFQKTILKSLPIKEVEKLVEKTLTYFSDSEDDEHLSKFSRNIKIFTSICEPKELKDGIIEVISKWGTQVAKPSFRIQLWIDKTIPGLPNDDIIENYFQSSTNAERLEIFKRVESEYRKKLVKKLVTHDDPINILEFIVAHLKQINGIGHNINIKSELYHADYWAGKVDYDLFVIIVNYFYETLAEKNILDLYFSGYFNSFPIDYVLQDNSGLTKDETEQILKSNQLSETDKLTLMRTKVEKELGSFLRFWQGSSKEDVGSLPETELGDDTGSKRETFFWVFRVAKKYLMESTFSQFETEVIEKIPMWIHFPLWESGYSDILPEEQISKSLLIEENLIQKVDKWLSDNRITKDTLVRVLKSNIQEFDSIANRKQFYILYSHLLALDELDIDVTMLDDQTGPSIKWFLKLANWIEGISTDFNYDEFKTKLVFLDPDHQIRFLRKLFHLAHTGKFELTVEKLNQLVRIDFNIFRISNQIHPEIPLDISVDIAIESLKSFAKNGAFLFESELIELVLKDLSGNRKYKFKIEELFEKCEGRYIANFNLERNCEIKKVYNDNDQFYFAIQFGPGEYETIYKRRGAYERFVPNENFEELKEKVKKLPGRRWIPDEKHWSVPSQYNEQVIEFARENRFFFDFPGNEYANNTHLAEFIRTDVPNGILFCEGRLSNEKDRTFNRAFWWCCNRLCFDNCETIHEPESWEKYTFLDFLLILGFNVNDGNKSGDFIERAKYYQFISAINRFNRLLERMYCEECENILYPIQDANFAHYRVTHFHCENQECTEYHKEVYLHHCLNWKCNSIIDSRRSKKCPNGLYICSNIICGCCCSHEMLSRRLENLKTTGGYIHQNLITMVAKKEGHLERAIHFCYKCGGEMTETRNDIFQCDNCNIQYDLTGNKFKRPHRHLNQDQGKHPKIPFQPETDEDKLPY